MKHLVEGLEGALLDAAVAICKGYRFGAPQPRAGGWIRYPLSVPGQDTLGACAFENGEWSAAIRRYSRDWSHGGPIIERERINLNYRDDDVWQAHYNGRWAVFGPTPLVAAMRAFVACRYGEWIDLPEGLAVGPSQHAAGDAQRKEMGS